MITKHPPTRHTRHPMNFNEYSNEYQTIQPVATHHPVWHGMTCFNSPVPGFQTSSGRTCHCLSGLRQRWSLNYRWTIVELSEFGGSILVMFMDANRWLLVRNSATNISSYPCANHGAGIFTIIYQRLPHKSPSFVGQYTSTWLRIWDRQAPGPALGSFMASSSHLAAERGSWTLRISVPTTGSPTSCEHQSLCERSQSPAPKKKRRGKQWITDF